MEANTKLWADSDGYVRFIAEFTERDECFINVDVYEVMSWVDDKSPCDKELYCKAYLKWDGCCHVWMGEEGYLHLCGVNDWKKHIAMMEWLYKLAETEIPRFCSSEKWEN